MIHKLPILTNLSGALRHCCLTALAAPTNKSRSLIACVHSASLSFLILSAWIILLPTVVCAGYRAPAISVAGSCLGLNDMTAEPTPDTELLQRIATGDVKAFAEFYDRHSTLLFSVAVKVLSDLHEAEEVLQDAVRLVWEKAPIYNPSLGKPSSWAVVITRNKAIDRLRVLQRKNEAIALLTAEAESEFATQRHSERGDVLAHETGDLLRGALADLPPEQRLAIELAFFTGLSQAEVATQLGQPLGTIKARIRRGMLTMRDVLEEQL